MRPIALVLFGILMLSLVAPLVESQGGIPGSGPGGRRGGERERVAADEAARDWNNLSSAARERGLARAEAARLFSSIAYQDGVVTSRFVRFNWSNGSVSDFAVRSGDNVTAYFDLSVTGFEPAQPSATGAVLRAMGNETFFAAHANPLGLFSYRVRNTPLEMTFDLAPGVNVTADNARTFMLTGTTGLHGHVVISENATYDVSADNRSVNVSLGPHARLVFLHHAQQTAFTATLHALRDATASGRLGGILSVVGDAEGPVQDSIFVGGVAMRATHARDGRLDVVVSSENQKGRSVIINVDPASIGLAAGADVAVTLDGEPIPMAANAAEALNSSAALAHASSSAEGVQVIVAVPTFSDHTITIAAATETQPPPTTSPTGTSTATPSPTGATPVAEADETPAAAWWVVVALVAGLALARRRA